MDALITKGLFPDLAETLLTEGLGVRFRATGDSMRPTICDGDVVTVRPVETASIKRHDIVLYRHEGGLTVHRVIAVEVEHRGERSFIVQGDGAPGRDDPVSATQILGRVSERSRAGRVVKLDGWSARVRRAIGASRDRLAGRRVAT